MSRAPSAAAAVRLAYFVTFLSAGVWLPYMPLYLASLGLDGARIGILGALAPGLRWLSALLLGWVADRRRIRHRDTSAIDMWNLGRAERGCQDDKIRRSPPDCTCVPGSTATRSTTPAVSVTTGISTFIDSTTATSWPAVTAPSS